MTIHLQFRKVVPPLQTAIAAVFGGWGLWLRSAILSRPFLGSTSWHSTAAYHVWPWPLRFAAILNMPAFVAGALLSWPLDSAVPGLPEWASTLPVLLFVPVLWYLIAAWAEGNLNIETNGVSARRVWFLLLFLILACAAAASVSEFVGTYTGWLPIGVAVWLVIGVGIKAFRSSKLQQSDLA